MKRILLITLSVLVALALLPVICQGATAITSKVGKGGLTIQDGALTIKDSTTTRFGVVKDTGVFTATPTTTTGTAWLLDFSTLTSGDGLKIKYLGTPLNGGKLINIYGGASGTTSVWSIAEGGDTTIAGPVSMGSTATVTGALTAPVIAAGTTITTATATADSTYYGKVTLITTNGQVDVTLPANGAAVGSWMDFLVTVENGAAVTFAAAIADTLVTANSLDSDSVGFATGHRIGAYVRFVSTGSVWVALNLGNTTMTVTDTD